MATTLGFTGMDRNTQAELSQAFGQAVSRLQLDMRLVDNGEADYVVVDMDSLYGPMSWMQLHNAGRKVIGYSSSGRSQTDYVLTRPYTQVAIDGLLSGLGVVAAPGQASSSPSPVAAAPTPSEAAPTPAAAPPSPAAVMAEQAAAPVAAPAAAPTPVPAPPPAPATLARDPVLADWLQPGRLSVRGRYQREGGPALYLDGPAGHYHGPTTLKSLESYFAQPLDEADFTPLDPAAWQTETASAGAAQPISRLLWFASLLEGKGRLLPHLDAEGRYRLTKWLQTEREFPKHFRIATAMMKGPATVAEIAAAASVTAAEVADFINAGVASGLTELVLPEPEPEPDAARGGLFGRKRGR